MTCPETCDTHDWICEQDAGHNGPHDCSADQSHKDRRYEQGRAARIAARKAAAEIAQLVETTPDVD